MNISTDMQTKIECTRRTYDGRTRSLMQGFQQSLECETQQNIIDAYRGMVYGILMGKNFMEAALREEMVREYARQTGVDVPVDYKKMFLADSRLLQRWAG